MGGNYGLSVYNYGEGSPVGGAVDSTWSTNPMAASPKSTGSESSTGGLLSSNIQVSLVVCSIIALELVSFVHYNSSDLLHIKHEKFHTILMKINKLRLGCRKCTIYENCSKTTLWA